MRFMVLVPGGPESEAGQLPPPELFEAMTRYNEELARAGVLLAADGLAPTSKGARVIFDGDRRTVVDGPFTESKELVAGYWILQVRSKEEAIAWVERAPFGGGVAIEVRQITELEDLGGALGPELLERERRLRAQTGSQG